MGTKESCAAVVGDAVVRDAAMDGTAMDHVSERYCLINQTGLNQADSGRAIVGGVVTARQCRKLLIAGQKPL